MATRLRRLLCSTIVILTLCAASFAQLSVVVSVRPHFRCMCSRLAQPTVTSGPLATGRMTPTLATTTGCLEPGS